MSQIPRPTIKDGMRSSDMSRRRTRKEQSQSSDIRRLPVPTGGLSLEQDLVAGGVKPECSHFAGKEAGEDGVYPMENTIHVSNGGL